MPVGSYNASESLMGSSPSGGIALVGGEFSEESDGWYGQNEVRKHSPNLLDATLRKAPDYLSGTSAPPRLEKLKKSAQVPGNALK